MSHLCHAMTVHLCHAMTVQSYPDVHLCHAMTVHLCYAMTHMPKTLPCLHSFCEPCLAGYIEKERGRSGKPSISCPSCDNMVVIPRGKAKTREYVEQLPINTLVSTILRHFLYGKLIVDLFVPASPNLTVG
jgi:hypothetical protein